MNYRFLLLQLLKHPLLKVITHKDGTDSKLFGFPPSSSDYEEAKQSEAPEDAPSAKRRNTKADAAAKVGACH